MRTPIIQYHLFMSKNNRQLSRSFVFLLGFPPEYYPTLPMMLNYFRDLTLVHIGDFSALLLTLDLATMDKLTFFIYSGILDSCSDILNILSSTIYIFDPKRYIIYKTNNILRQITTVENSLLFESKSRRGFFHLTTEIARYVWYRLFFSVLSRICLTDVAKGEFLTYMDQKTRRQKEK
jgi:hypothetical protein